jgi:hypothetical protein
MRIAVSAVALGLAAGASLGLASPARADILELADGRVVEGAVSKDGQEYVVRSRFGESRVAAKDVKTWTKSKPVDEQVREHLGRLAPDDAANRALLARWLVDLGREEEGRALADAVLEIDPENADAHAVLGHVRHAGRWCTPDEAKRAQGLEQHGGEWYTPEEWKNLSDAARNAAAEGEAKARAAAIARDVNEAVRLMLSPDPSVRARGKKRLESLAAETGSEKLRELARNVEDYVKAVDEYQAKAAATAGSGEGMVLGEIRATLSKLKRPIQEFSTSLASNIGGAPVRIQLPELEVIRVRTTAPIPVAVH